MFVVLKVVYVILLVQLDKGGFQHFLLCETNKFRYLVLNRWSLNYSFDTFNRWSYNYSFSDTHLAFFSAVRKNITKKQVVWRSHLNMLAFSGYGTSACDYILS